MASKQVVKKAPVQQEENEVLIFQLPQGVNVIQPTKMGEVIFIKDGVLEIDSTNTVLLEHVRAIEGASDITKTIARFRGE